MFGNHAYPTFQVFLAIFVAMVIAIVLMPAFIKLLTRRHIGQEVRADGPSTHLVKQGTPTMGGLVILVAVTIAVLLLAPLDAALWLVLLSTLATGALGFVDDASKVLKKRSLGLTPKAKLLMQALISTVFCLLAVNSVGIPATISFPFVHWTLDLGVLTTHVGGFAIPWLYVIFVFLLMAGLSNAVNLTDGLDGLAGGTVMIVMAAMAAIAFRSDHLDVAVFSAACAGACIGFLWFNCYPASIFMGDTGSLALGTALAGVAVICKAEVCSLIIGGLFVVEALSVLIQVLHFKRTKKRVFLMAPIHHHFEKKGWSETKVVIRFWIITGMFACLGFAMYFAGTL
ncbi:MAG: phospho-N-acetylmuramoyl-pentapeptide-transferase [Coriobacteriales bacterium]|nr:phospho-N-acetylmuramoyl-pentapeptide-transferase [Coriobacteriales bacterium]